MTNKITVAEALNELKLLDKKIKSTLEKLDPLGLGNKNTETYSNNVLLYKNESEWSNKQKALYQSVNDLMKRKHNLKTGILLSNATTKVDMNGTSMTVTEAIETKNSLLYKKELLEKLVTKQHLFMNQLENQKNKLENGYTKFLEVVMKSGTEDENKTQVESLRKMYYDQNELKLIDPLDCKKQIEELSNEIDTFQSKIDFVLNRSNILTELDV